jgi:cytolysin-activating lysine-acyltransferase
MPNIRKKKTHGDKPMNRTATKRTEEPSPGVAALKEALAGFGVSSDAAGGFGSDPAASSANRSQTAGTTQTQAESPPKTVAQVLGEITWLMTQSPRHKAISNGLSCRRSC